MSKNTRRIWRMLKRTLRGVWVDKSEFDRRIDLPSGGSITVVTTSDADNIRSEGYDGMVIDEAARVAEDVWSLVLRPMLIDRRGWCIWITTPNGHNWWKKEVWDKSQDAGWGSWQRPTHDNRTIPPEELEALEEEYRGRPHAYAQEILAQFVSMEGAEFPADYFEKIWHKGAWPETVEASAIAVDPSLGRAKGDYSAIVSASYCLEDGLIYVDADLERRPTPQLVADGLAMARRTPELLAFGIESNAYQELLAPEFDRQCEARGQMLLPIHLLDNYRPSKETRIRRIAPYLANHKIRLRAGSPGCQLLEDQLRAFPLPSVHDDGPDALEMAIRLLDWLVTGNEPTDHQPEERLVAV